MTRRERLAYVTVVVLVAILAIFFGSRKVGYHVDEIWNYGLANNMGSIVPNIEFGKVYTGMGPFENFLEVRDGERFNYVNVWHNQADDVHPPLYYIFVHTVCSLFPNTYSKWYGIAVNLIWMVFILYFLFKLAKSITNDSVSSIGIVLAYGVSVAFLDTLLFIRMYTQFTFFAIAAAYLFKVYWDRDLDRKFYILYALLAILGLLTHYYFLIYIFFMSGMFAIHLIQNKRFKEIRSCIITAGAAGMIYLALWYHIARHLFRGYRGKEALRAAVTPGGLVSKATRLFMALSLEGFGSILIVFFVFILFNLGKKAVKKELHFSYEYALLLAGLLYFLVVAKISPFTDFRYTMPVVFIFFISVFINTTEILGRFLKKNRASYCLTALFIAFSAFGICHLHFYVPVDYYSAEEIEIDKKLENEDCAVFIGDVWEALTYYPKVQSTKSYMFLNEDDKDILLSNKDRMVIVPDAYAEKLFEGVEAKEVLRTGELGYYRLEDNSVLAGNKQ